jgi:integrase
MYYARIKKNGKEIRKSLETTDREVAKATLAEKRGELDMVDPAARKFTIQELCDRYLTTVQHRKPSTILAKEGILKRIKTVWPEGKLQQIADVKPSHVQAFLSQQGSRMGKSSYNQYLTTIREMFAMAVSDRLIAKSPAAALKYVKRDKPVRRTPTFEEFQAVVTDIRAQKYNSDAEDSADFVEFLGLAGLGQAEASSLTWADIDFGKGVIITFRHKTSQGFVVPLYPQLRPLLLKLKGDEDPKPEEHVFRVKDAKKSLQAACERLKLPHYSHRAFRRMFITRAIEKGVDVKVVAEWQGHRDGGKLILDTYSHVNRVHSTRMAQLMTT